ncbi:MAG: hypothetical protein RBR68_14605 [Tenuifilaceae bacterium]|nr:hypothetical protein [Tenuifilaceae bacterium]
MKKLVLGAAMLLFAQFSFGQAVTDQAVIPVSVTLNAILRLTVTSGGNIVFVVNTIQQYEEGIEGTARTTTKFRVSSSRDFAVTMVPENVTHFTGLETGNVADFPITNVGYAMTAGAGAIDAATIKPLAATNSLVSNAAIGNEEYSLMWHLATSDVVDLATASLLIQSIPADIYVNNMFLTLAPQ